MKKTIFYSSSVEHCTCREMEIIVDQWIPSFLVGGVPLNVIEVIGLPPDGSLERQQAFQLLREIGACDVKGGRIPRTGEEVMVAIFESADTAMKALHFKHPHFALSIPRNNHAKFILTVLQMLST